MSHVPASYRFCHTFGSRIVFVAPTLMLLGALIGFIALLLNPTARAPGALPALGFFLAFSAFMLYWWLRFPTVIEWHGDGTVSFRGPVRSVRVPIAEIESIRPGYALGFLVLRYSGKKLQLLNQFDNFHEFIERIRDANRNIAIRGC